MTKRIISIYSRHKQIQSSNIEANIGLTIFLRFFFDNLYADHVFAILFYSKKKNINKFKIDCKNVFKNKQQI